jgi:hypothetical protein
MTKYRIIILLCLSIFLPLQSTFAEELLDPTRPMNFSSSSPASSLVLSAIMISADHRLAVINGKIRHIGDQFDDFKVVSIEDNVVFMSSSTANFTLTLQDKSPASQVKFAK